MTPEHWRDLLATWSREILAVAAYRQEFPREVVETGWLGYPGASEDELTATESRLGLTLPPSYRTFLTVTDGWRTTKTFIDCIRPVGEITWYREAHPGRLAGWLEGDRLSARGVRHPARGADDRRRPAGSPGRQRLQRRHRPAHPLPERAGRRVAGVVLRPLGPG